MLRTYRAVREVIADIQQAATVLDEHVGRFQVFGAREHLAHAVTEAQVLGRRLEELELQLNRCGRSSSQEDEISL
jgi:hypothetical protein